MNILFQTSYISKAVQRNRLIDFKEPKDACTKAGVQVFGLFMN